MKKLILFLYKKDIQNKAQKKTSGLELLKNKKIFLMLISFFNDKIFSKFVSIQNQIDKIKNIFI